MEKQIGHYSRRILIVLQTVSTAAMLILLIVCCHEVIHNAWARIEHDLLIDVILAAACLGGLLSLALRPLSERLFFDFIERLEVRDYDSTNQYDD